jgi:ABC-2 type transport system permease protein
LPTTLISAASLRAFPQRFEIRGGGGARFWPFGRTIDGKILSGFAPEPPTENPSALVAGSVDLAFVTIYLYPLLIVALTCNIVSADRDAGILAMVAAQPIDTRRWLAARALVRGAIAAIGVALPMVATSLLMPAWSHDTALRLALWGIGVVGYCALWFTAAILISLRTASAANSAMVAAVLWLVAVVVIPAMLAIAQPLLAPASTRILYTNEERAVSLDVNPRVDAAIASLNQQVRRLPSWTPAAGRDHPTFTAPLTASAGADLLTALDAGVWSPTMPAAQLSRGFAVARRVLTEQRLAPVLARLDEEDRHEALFYSMTRYASPALLMQSVFDEVAGTGRDRRLRFLGQIDTYVRERDDFFTRRILENRNITLADVSTLTPFRYVEEAPRSLWRRIVLPVTGIFAVCAGCLWAAMKSAKSLAL